MVESLNFAVRPRSTPNPVGRKYNRPFSVLVGRVAHPSENSQVREVRRRRLRRSRVGRRPGPGDVCSCWRLALAAHHALRGAAERLADRICGPRRLAHLIEYQRGAAPRRCSCLAPTDPDDWLACLRASHLPAACHSHARRGHLGV